MRRSALASGSASNGGRSWRSSRAGARTFASSARPRLSSAPNQRT